MQYVLDGYTHGHGFPHHIGYSTSPNMEYMLDRIYIRDMVFHITSDPVFLHIHSVYLRQDTHMDIAFHNTSDLVFLHTHIVHDRQDTHTDIVFHIVFHMTSDPVSPYTHSMCYYIFTADPVSPHTRSTCYYIFTEDPVSPHTCSTCYYIFTAALTMECLDS